MKTTIELPDELMRAVKMRAVSQDRRLKDVVADLLRKGLAADEPASQTVRHRVKLPLIVGGHPPEPGSEPTPEQLDDMLAEEEARNFIP